MLQLKTIKHANGFYVLLGVLRFNRSCVHRSKWSFLRCEYMLAFDLKVLSQNEHAYRSTPMCEAMCSCVGEIKHKYPYVIAKSVWKQTGHSPSARKVAWIACRKWCTCVWRHRARSSCASAWRVGWASIFHKSHSSPWLHCVGSCAAEARAHSSACKHWQIDTVK